MALVSIHEDQPDHCFATWRNVLFVLWRGPRSVRACQLLDRIATRFVRSLPVGVGVMSVIEAGAPPPPYDIRIEMARLQQHWNASIHAYAVALTDSGFHAAAMLSAITAINLMAPPHFPQYTFKSIEEASSWFAPRVPHIGGKALSRQALLEVLHGLRTGDEVAHAPMIGRGISCPNLTDRPNTDVDEKR
ncbi:MAG: hypothetical protein ACPGUV_14025 [Polyangiales bacterium]